MLNLILAIVDILVFVATITPIVIIALINQDRVKSMKYKGFEIEFFQPTGNTH